MIQGTYDEDEYRGFEYRLYERIMPDGERYETFVLVGDEWIEVDGPFDEREDATRQTETFIDEVVLHARMDDEDDESTEIEPVREPGSGDSLLFVDEEVCPMCKDLRQRTTWTGTDAPTCPRHSPTTTTTYTPPASQIDTLK